jgi:hypothetical protein
MLTNRPGLRLQRKRDLRDLGAMPADQQWFTTVPTNVFRPAVTATTARSTG